MRKSENKIKFDNHPNPYNLEWKTIRGRIYKGETLEKAMSYPLVDNKISENKIKFNNRPNPYNLSWITVYNRLRKGQTFEQAISYPENYYTKPMSEDRIKFEKHSNPYNLNWLTVQKRIYNGETLEKAISYPVSEKNKISKDKIKFKNHANPYNLKWYTVLKRLKSETFEQAMSYPAGRYPLEIYKNGFVMFEDQWTSINDLEMIFDKEITKNMIKSGIEINKLFKRRE